jgi:protein subunit release factor B
MGTLPPAAIKLSSNPQPARICLRGEATKQSSAELANEHDRYSNDHQPGREEDQHDGSWRNEVPSTLMQKDSWRDHRTPEDGEDHADRFKRKAHLNLP